MSFQFFRSISEHYAADAKSILVVTPERFDQVSIVDQGQPVFRCPEGVIFLAADRQKFRAGEVFGVDQVPSMSTHCVRLWPSGRDPVERQLSRVVEQFDAWATAGSPASSHEQENH